MKVVVFGGYGQLGSDIVNEFKSQNHNVVPISHSQFDILKDSDLNTIFKSYLPDVIINCVAKHDVGYCEQNEPESLDINCNAADKLSKLCHNQGSLMVQISTDYVFDGEKNSPYIETDNPNPINIYGKTKYLGELAVQNNCDRYIILRVASLFGNKGSSNKGPNFVEKILSMAKSNDYLNVVSDQVMSPTYTSSVAKQLNLLISEKKAGLFHCTCQGECSWYEFAKKVLELSSIDIKINQVKSTTYPCNFKRPMYTVLQNKKLDDCGLNIMPSWQDALVDYLDKRNGDEK